MSVPEQGNESGTRAAVLNGWKDIAAYFGKGVRTVQRWEAELQLPVHRMAGRKGEVVYAVPAELDEWRRRQERAGGNGLASLDGEAGPGEAEPPATAVQSSAPAAGAAPGTPVTPGPSPQGRYRLAIGAAALVLVTLAVAAAAWALVFRPWRPPAPVGLRIEGDHLVALDASGAPLWTQTLPYSPGRQGEYREAMTGPKRGALVEDIDRDGRPEVLLTTTDAALQNGDLFCYTASGRLRWRWRPTQSARFGQGLMAPPWIPLFLVVTRAADATPSLWVSWANRPDFGAFVERLDPATGHRLAVYWSAGHVTALTTGTLNGRPVVFMGAANNEHKGASLAVYESSLTAGSAPAANPDYACGDCPPGRPLAFFVFPKTSVGRELVAESGSIFVHPIMQDAAGQLKVVVVQGRNIPTESATVIYRFDPGLRLTGAEFVDDYRLTHRRLEREGRLSHPMGTEEDGELFPVLSWEGGKFVEIAAPQKRP